MPAEQALAAEPAHHKPHFLALDGLRGVAAICVVIFHFSEMVIWNYSVLWIGHGFLAVDFFFCLSGFVMGYAYDSRLAAMGLSRFLKARLIRLHPMVAFFANPFGIAHGYTYGRLALLFLASVFLVPYGVMQERSLNLFGLNAPAWSLFWEYVANLVFGLVLYRIRRSALIAITFVAALVLCYAGHRAGNLSGGWSARNFWDGGARVAFSFSAGLLVYRMRWRLRTPIGFPLLAIMLVAALVMPYAAGAWVREAAVIILYFPFLITLGAGATMGPYTARVCRFLGDLSYPLYMTHYAVIWIWGDYADRHKLALHGFGLGAALGTLTMIAFATLTVRFYDAPLRAWLQSRTNATPPTTSTSHPAKAH